jgi:hypothetical protein
VAVFEMVLGDRFLPKHTELSEFEVSELFEGQSDKYS